METKDIPNATPTPWAPMTNPVDKKVIGKLLEELGECSSAVARCFIQGIDGANPETGELNKDWLASEVADVFCLLDMAMVRFSLDRGAILERAQRKYVFLQVWLKQPPTDNSEEELENEKASEGF